MTHANNALVTPFSYSLASMSNKHAQDREQQTPQPIPVSITKIQGELVQVKVEAKGRKTPFTIPEFIVPQAFSEWMRLPTQVGDKGWVIPSNYYLGGMSGLNGGTANFYDRANLTNMVFIPVSQKKFPNNENRNLNQVFINGKEGTRMQTTDGKFFHDIDGKNGKHIIGADGSTITFTKGKIEFTINGKTHTFTEDMYKSAGDVRNKDDTSLTTHIHGGPPSPNPGS